MGGPALGDPQHLLVPNFALDVAATHLAKQDAQDVLLAQLSAVLFDFCHNCIWYLFCRIQMLDALRYMCCWCPLLLVGEQQQLSNMNCLFAAALMHAEADSQGLSCVFIGIRCNVADTIQLLVCIGVHFVLKELGIQPHPHNAQGFNATLAAMDPHNSTLVHNGSHAGHLVGSGTLLA